MRDVSGTGVKPMGMRVAPSRSDHCQLSVGVAADEEEAVALVDLGDVEWGVFVAVVECHEAAADAGLDDVNFALTQRVERWTVGGDGAEHDIEAFGVEEAA